MKKRNALILLFIFTSCKSNEEKGIMFRIQNESDTPISTIIFTTSEELNSAEFDVIEKTKSITGFLSIRDNKTDGNYVLQFTRADGKMTVQDYAYYSNGMPFDPWATFQIKNDTVVAKFGNGVP